MSDNRLVVITGGFGALGSAVARAFAGAGKIVALLDQAPAPPDALRRELGDRAIFLDGVNLTDFDATNVVVQSLAAKHPLHVLINIAGGFRWETLEGGSPQTWDLLYGINLRTAVNTSKAALAHLKASGSGRIINIAAAAAVRATAGMGAYAASKAGVIKLTESLADELKGTGITVNAVLPSIIDTPANRADMPEADFSKWVAPAELAGVILFLASDQAKSITGAALPVTGGL